MNHDIIRTQTRSQRKGGMSMRKIDRRRHYIMVIDTETANTITKDDGSMDMSDVLVYDCGWAVVDKHGNVYETASYVNTDIFIFQRDLMQSAYYANKIPNYINDIEAGNRILTSTYKIREAMLNTIERWNIKHICAHNARFDYNALNRTQSYVTSGKYRYWFPFNSVIIWDTISMAQDVICKMPTYQKFCATHGYTLKNGKPRKTAEILYKFISGNIDFEESHTGLEDVLIEKEILAYCFRQHKAMKKELWPAKEYPPITAFQRELAINLSKYPTLRRIIP